MSKSTKKLRKFIPVEEAFARWEKNPKFRNAYDELEEEFALVPRSSRHAPRPASRRSSSPSG